MLTADGNILIASGNERPLSIEPSMANRHGLITGATGTGKTVTLQSLAEGFSELGIPVFMADVKGDLAGLGMEGHPSGGIAARVTDLHLPELGYANRAFPVCFWDAFGENGHPLRTTISEMGPLLLSQLLGLNDVQSGLLHLVFRIADDRGLLLLDMKDLQSMLAHVAENRQAYIPRYGNISTASVGAIQRGLLRLEEEGGGMFFGEPALDIADILRPGPDGRGILHILSAGRLMNSPRIYSSLLLWLLSELFEKLPECGDRERPRLVFFFDEAHLIFDNAAPPLLEKIEQVVRLIRSRGVGIYFVTQNPADIPDTVLGQLGNRIQHALRAFTPKERKALKSAADSFRPNPAIDTMKAIEELGVGEALVSFLDKKGVPQMVEKALVIPPQSRVGAISSVERQTLVRQSPLCGRYDRMIDRESAYEILQRAVSTPPPAPGSSQRGSMPGKEAGLGDFLQTFAKQTGRTLTTTVGREIGKSLVRGLLGGLFGKRR
ncbi:MAG: DUF853 domain-containing protein [Desulfovibrio sp.]|nr:DUF853 domain-containing protein [Desulfovibrio sp.]